MPSKDQLKSARKLFMVNKTKSDIMQLNDTPIEQVDEKLADILAPLTKVFGEAEGLAILEDAIAAADAVITSAIGQAVTATVKEETDKSNAKKKK